jgi:uncharacterized protein (DUF885 family)
MEEGLREDNLLNQLADEYFLEWVRFYPGEATLHGHHEYDGELGNFTRGAIQDRLAWIQDFRQRLLGIDVTRISHSGYVDILLLTSSVKAEAHKLGALEQWRRSPIFYNKRIRSGLGSLLRSESPSDSEIQSLLSRLEQIPSLIESARENIERPPRLLVEDAIYELRLSSTHIEDFAVTLGTSSSPRKVAELGRVSRDSAHALNQFIAYLESEVLPNASPSFAIGSNELSRELLYQEMEDAPLDTIRGIAELEIRSTRATMEEIVARLGVSGGPATVLADLTTEHPSSTELVRTTESILREITQFTREHNLFEENPEDGLKIVGAPPFIPDLSLRWTFLNTPGNLDQSEKPSYFMLALPQDDELPQRVEARLRNFNSRALRLAVIREIHPGRFLSYSHRKSSNSRIRQLIASNANIDGWSHYVEQMLLDEGYEWDDPALRLVQLHNALIEQCRLATAIGLHSGQMSMTRAAQVFRENAFLDAERAMREARQVAGDWTGASAALGKLQILKLREDYIRDEPSRTLHSFHEEFLSGAGLPLKLVRLLILPEDQRPTLEY